MRPGIFVSRTREKLGCTCDQIGRTLEPCIILLSLVFHMLQLESSPVGGSASQSAAQPVDVTPEQLDGSNTRNYQRIDKQREQWT